MTLYAKEAQLLSQKKKAVETEIFNVIAERCDRAIRNDAAMQTHTQFTVPTFIFGMPNYSITRMYMRLYRSLKERGYAVYSTDVPNELFIDWSAQRPDKKTRKKVLRI